MSPLATCPISWASTARKFIFVHALKVDPWKQQPAHRFYSNLLQMRSIGRRENTHFWHFNTSALRQLRDCWLQTSARCEVHLDRFPVPVVFAIHFGHEQGTKRTHHTKTKQMTIRLPRFKPPAHGNYRHRRVTK